VRVPVDNRIGEEGQGWSFGKLLLDNGTCLQRRGAAQNKRMLARLKPIAASQGLFDDPVFAQRVAEVEVETRRARMADLRALSEHGSEVASAWRPARCCTCWARSLQQKSGRCWSRRWRAWRVAYPALDGADAPAGYPPGPDMRRA